MKKFLLKIILFFMAIIAIDFLFGVICQYMNNHAKGGSIASRYFVCKKSNEDILIFGSSRAKHHYVPDIIEDSLGMTCYNTGEEGNGIILSYGFLRMVSERYTPKLIVYDVSRFDIYVDDNIKYVNYLKPYYYENGIDSLFWDIEPKTRLMMCSNLYRFNTSCLRILGNYIHPVTNYPDGYMPLYNTMPQEIATPFFTSETVENKEVDPVKLKYFERFILLAQKKKIPIVCCVSPMYNGIRKDDFYKPIKDLCKQHEIPFLYMGYTQDISENVLYFQDRTHLNNQGAIAFTRQIIKELKLSFAFYHNENIY